MKKIKGVLTLLKFERVPCRMIEKRPLLDKATAFCFADKTGACFGIPSILSGFVAVTYLLKNERDSCKGVRISLTPFPLDDPFSPLSNVRDLLKS